MLNCKWKEKLGRYGDKIFNHLEPVISASNNSYIFSLALASSKPWKPTSLSNLNELATALALQHTNISIPEAIRLFKYGLFSSQLIYTKPFMNRFSEIGFAISGIDYEKIFKAAHAQEFAEFLPTLMKREQHQWRNQRLLAYLNSEVIDYAEISDDSKQIILTIDGKQVVIYSMSYCEESFVDIVKLIESHKIENFALPLQSEECEVKGTEIHDKLNMLLQDSKKFKLMDVHKLVVSNVFGVKNTDILWSIVLRNPKSKYYLYYPTTERVMGFCNDFIEVEKNIRNCVLLDNCRVMYEVSEDGCYLCQKHRIFPIPYQDFAIYSAPFIQRLINYYGNMLSQAIAKADGSLMILCQSELVFSVMKAMIKPVVDLDRERKTMTEEDKLLANMFFTRESQFVPPKKFKDHYEAIIESFSPVNLEPWRKEKFEFSCLPIKKTFRVLNSEK